MNDEIVKGEAKDIEEPSEEHKNASPDRRRKKAKGKGKAALVKSPTKKRHFLCLEVTSFNSSFLLELLIN